MPPFGGPPGFGGPGGSAVMQKLMELRTALADPNTTSEQFQEKLGQYVMHARRLRSNWPPAGLLELTRIKHSGKSQLP
jgi:hypothetical protein